MGREEPGHAVTSSPLCFQRCHDAAEGELGPRQSSELPLPKATPRPAPVPPSTAPLLPRMQTALVLPPPSAPASVWWPINFQPREVKLCAPGVSVARSPGPAPRPPPRGHPHHGAPPWHGAAASGLPWFVLGPRGGFEEVSPLCGGGQWVPQCCPSHGVPTPCHAGCGHEAARGSGGARSSRCAWAGHRQGGAFLPPDLQPRSPKAKPPAAGC